MMVKKDFIWAMLLIAILCLGLGLLVGRGVHVAPLLSVASSPMEPPAANRLTQGVLEELKAEVAEGEVATELEERRGELEQLAIRLDTVEQAVVSSGSSVSGRLLELAGQPVNPAEKQDLLDRAAAISKLSSESSRAVAAINAERATVASAVQEAQALIATLRDAKETEVAEAAIRTAESRLESLRGRGAANVRELEREAARDMRALESEIRRAGEAYRVEIDALAQADGGMDAADVKEAADAVAAAIRTLPEIIDALEWVAASLGDLLDFLSNFFSKLWDALSCIFKSLFGDGCGGGSGGGGKGPGTDSSGQAEVQAEGEAEQDGTTTELPPQDRPGQEAREENAAPDGKVMAGVDVGDFAENSGGTYDLSTGTVQLPAEVGATISNFGATQTSTGPDTRYRWAFSVRGNAFHINQVDIKDGTVLAVFTVDGDARALQPIVDAASPGGKLVLFDGIIDNVDGAKTATFRGLPSADGVPVTVKFARHADKDGVQRWSATGTNNLAVNMAAGN